MRQDVVVIIPARWASTRFPGKPLADIGGKPMIQHVYERASMARVDGVAVATDDDRIAAAVREFGGQVIMTASHHPSGTDRVAEAANTLNAGLIVNVQGDEPLLDPAMIDLAVAPLRADPAIPMGTLAHPIHSMAEMNSLDIVKVVLDRQGFALYFSRAPIPVHRDGPNEPHGALRHVGLYVYQAPFLQQLATLAPTFLEQQEKLEQLRVLEHGFRIHVALTTRAGIGVDTPGDLERARELYADPAYRL